MTGPDPLIARPARTRGARLLLELTVALRAAARVLDGEGERLAGWQGLSLSQWQVLEAASELSLGTVSDLARHLDLARQSVQRTADLLVESGLLESRENPAHRRAPLLATSARGRSALERLANARTIWANQRSAGLDTEALRQAAVILDQLGGRTQASPRK